MRRPMRNAMAFRVSIAATIMARASDHAAETGCGVPDPHGPFGQVRQAPLPGRFPSAREAMRDIVADPKWDTLPATGE